MPLEVQQARIEGHGNWIDSLRSSEGRELWSITPAAQERQIPKDQSMGVPKRKINIRGRESVVAIVSFFAIL